jgi:hypothetical protein
MIERVKWGSGGRLQTIVKKSAIHSVEGKKVHQNVRTTK